MSIGRGDRRSALDRNNDFSCTPRNAIVAGSLFLPPWLKAHLHTEQTCATWGPNTGDQEQKWKSHRRYMEIYRNSGEEGAHTWEEECLMCLLCLLRFA